jgi:hypothetical protein
VKENLSFSELVSKAFELYFGIVENLSSWQHKKVILGLNTFTNHRVAPKAIKLELRISLLRIHS